MATPRAGAGRGRFSRSGGIGATGGAGVARRASGIVRSGRGGSGGGRAERCFSRADLLAERGNARDVLDVVEDAGAEGGLRERVDRREDGGVGAHGDLLQSGRVLGAGGLAEVAALAVSGRLARAAEAREAEVRSGRAGDRQKNLGEGRPGERVVGGDAGESRGGKWAHPFWLFGELKQSGAGERAGSAVSAAACASLTPWARRAREGVMGDSALAKSKKGEDKSAACEGGEGRVSRRRGQRSRVDSDTPGCGQVGRVEARERARGAASPGRVRCRRKLLGGNVKCV